MHDSWTDRLSEYLDGDLNAAEMELLERHLAGCDECRATLQQLQDVVAAAHSLEDREPPRDLWAGIAAGLAAEPQHADVHVLPMRRPAAARRFSMSAPQLAVAALLLMAFSAGAAWLISGAAGNGTGADYQQGTIFHAAHDGPGDVRLVGDQPAPPAPTDLTATLDAARATLDPATVEVLERSIESINAAIADAHAALEADPGNPYLQRQLDSTLERRDAVIRRAGGVRRGGT